MFIYHYTSNYCHLIETSNIQLINYICVRENFLYLRVDPSLCNHFYKLKTILQLPCLQELNQVFLYNLNLVEVRVKIDLDFVPCGR